MDNYKRDGDCKLVQFTGRKLEDLLADVRIFVDILGLEHTMLTHDVTYDMDGTESHVITVFYYFKFDLYEEFDPLQEEIRINTLINARYGETEPKF